MVELFFSRRVHPKVETLLVNICTSVPEAQVRAGCTAGEQLGTAGEQPRRLLGENQNKNKNAFMKIK